MSRRFGAQAPLRVGMLAPISWRTPPRSYGPWEQFVSLLTEGLVQRGVDVTLFATGDSLTQAKLASVVPRAYSEDPGVDAKVAEALHISSLFERASDFDIIHNSYDFLPLAFSRLTATPMVTTVHGFSSEKIVPVYEKYNATNHYVAISEADKHPALDYSATIHHGIDLASLPLANEPRNYLLFFGRIHPEKGTAEAIAVAQKAKLPLVIAGIIQDEKYFEECVKPHIDNHQVRFLGAVSSEDKGKLLGGARALLHLVSFDEPFGFSVVEAMACGTPVLAARRGSMPELISEGVNGSLLDDLTQVDIPALGQFAPASVREEVARRFSHERMVDEYLALYHRILQGGAPSA